MFYLESFLLLLPEINVFSKTKDKEHQEKWGVENFGTEKSSLPENVEVGHLPFINRGFQEKMASRTKACMIVDIIEIQMISEGLYFFRVSNNLATALGYSALISSAVEHIALRFLLL